MAAAQIHYCVREFEIDHQRVLRLHQILESDVNGVVWDAALVLAGYLMKRHQENPTFLNNKKVLELGSGIGAPGMLCAAISNCNCILTDDKIDLLAHNVEQNRGVFRGSVQAIPLGWSKEAAEALDAAANCFDYVLIADCIYYKESIQPLVETLKVLIKGDTTLFLTQELRESEQQIQFLKDFLIQAREFLRIEEIPINKHHDDYRSEDIMLFACKRK